MSARPSTFILPPPRVRQQEAQIIREMQLALIAECTAIMLLERFVAEWKGRAR